jgi:hypothetical protein
MKKIIIFSILSLCLMTTVFAQRSGERMKNRMEGYQIAFITDKLNLTSEEAQKFWPIYNQYKDQAKKLRQDAKPQKEIQDMTDAEAEQFIKSSFEKDSKELDLKKEFVQKLRGVLPPKKIAQLQGLEKEFKKELLEKAKERRRAKE